MYRCQVNALATAQAAKRQADQQPATAQQLDLMAAVAAPQGGLHVAECFVLAVSGWWPAASSAGSSAAGRRPLAPPARTTSASEAADGSGGSGESPPELRLDQKLAVSLFSVGFAASLHSCRSRAQLAARTCADVMQSKPLRKVLATVLQLGNVLNRQQQQRARRGAAAIGASGFSIESLLKLKDTRSVDGQTTLIRVLAQILQQSILEEPPDFDDEHGDGEAESAEAAAEKGAGVWLAQSLPNLAAVQGISLGDLEAELGRLDRGVQMARRESALTLAAAPSVAGSSNGKLPEPMAEGVVVASPSVSTSASVLETAAGAYSHLALVVC